jgi:hypothetical protein
LATFSWLFSLQIISVANDALWRLARNLKMIAVPGSPVNGGLAKVAGGRHARPSCNVSSYRE